MRQLGNPAAIIEQAFDIDREVDETLAIKADVEAASETLKQRSLRLGQKYKSVRAKIPAKGPKSAAWGEYLKRIGETQPTAYRYMELAGYVQKVSFTVNDTDDEIPTYAEAGIDKRPRLSDEPSREFVRKFNELGDQILEEMLTPSIAPIGSSFAEEIETTFERLRSHGKSIFSAAQHLDNLCNQHGARLASPAIATLRSMLCAAQASIADTLRLMEGSN